MSTDVSIPEPVASFIAAVNVQDESGSLGRVVDGGHVDDWGRVFTGHDQIKTWSDREFLGSNGVLTPTEVTVGDGEITVVGDWRSSHANGLSRFTFAVDGDRILSMTIREG